MNTYLLIPLIEVLFCIGLLVVLIISGRRHMARWPFSLFLAFMASWGFFIFMMRASSNLTDALFWEKLVFLSILSAAIFFYRFTLALTGTRPKKYVTYPLYIFYFVVMGLIPTGLIVNGMQMMWYGKAPSIGPLFFPYVLGAYAPMVLSMRILIKHWRQSRIIDERVRDQYVIAGIAAMFIGATTDYLPPLGITMYPLGIIGNILFCLAATIAMLRHDLLEMKVMLRKGATYSLTSLLIFGIFGAVIFTLSQFFHNLMSPVSLTLTLLTVFAAALIFQPVLSRLQHTVDRWFFRERYDYIQTLKKFTHETKGDLDLEQLAASLVTAVANGMQSRGVYLLLPSPSTGNYVTYSYCGQKCQGRLAFSANSPLIATMKQQDNVVDHNDLDVIPSLVSLTTSDRLTLLKNNIDLLLPLKNDGKLAGMMLLGSKVSREPYSNEERKLLSSVLSEVAVSIDNASLYEGMKRKHSDLQKAMDGVIHAVSLVVETRDPYTAGHQRRVAELARAISKEMGLSEWQTMGIHVAGLLHDVGKVAVPSDILSKPGKINQYEFSIIKNHSRIGFEILQKIDFPWPVTKAILQHHERLDGSGYPDGLTSENIILEAKILGVADVVEAMSSHRPYRPALGLERALQEIKESSGTLYDPEVVDSCLRLLKKNEPEFNRLMAAASKLDYVTTSAPG